MSFNIIDDETIMWTGDKPFKGSIKIGVSLEDNKISKEDAELTHFLLSSKRHYGNIFYLTGEQCKYVPEDLRSYFARKGRQVL